MKKKLTALILSMVMALSLVACQTAPAAAPAASPAAEASAQQEAPAENATVDWPTRTVTIITTNTGGDMDYLARLLSKKMTEDFGVNVVVVNQTESPATIRQVLAADADGYTVWIGKSNVVIEQANGSLDDISLDDMDFIGNLTANPAQVLAVKDTLGVHTLQELYDLAASKPGELRITDNIGSNTEVTCKQLLDAGFQITPVDIGGSSAKMTAILGDHVEIIASLYGSMEQYIQSGEFVALGTLSLQRNPFFPDIPTCVEQGFDVNFDTTLFAAFKGGTDPAITAFFADYLKNLMENDQAFTDDLAAAQQLTPMWMDGEETKQYLNDQYERLFEIGFATR